MKKFKIEAAHCPRHGYYLVYGIRLDDFQFCIRRAHKKKDVTRAAIEAVKRLGYFGGVDPKQIIWRTIGMEGKAKKELIEMAPISAQRPKLESEGEFDDQPRSSGNTEPTPSGYEDSPPLHQE